MTARCDPGGFALVQEILVIVYVQCVEFILGTHTTGQGLTVAPELHIAQSGSHALVAVDVEGIEVDAGPDIATGVHTQRVGDRDALLFSAHYSGI